MKKFKLNKIPLPGSLKTIKNFFSTEDSGEIAKLNKNIYMQLGLGLLTVVLTVVILFAMTSAWYTNIANTSGLVFEVEPWGFDGEIIVNTDSVKAGPGDEGIVHIEAENESENIIDISLTVSKTGMSEEMQKRMFFYVETTGTRNEETMEKVYVNASEGYTYTVFGKSSLTLTEQVSNAPNLRWMWVYDVLGYYVLGKENDDGTVNVEEYLRPIEYDYDEATFKKTGEGENLSYELDTVDGERSPAEFLYDISKTDGYDGILFSYDGEFNENLSAEAGKYYAVDVDENRYGVYAYLCTYTEIEKSIKDDTYWGELANLNKNGENLTDKQKKLLTYTATLNLSAQKNNAVAVTVSDADSLNNIIGIADYVQLGSNITLSEPLEIPSGTRMMIDLNGKTITGTDDTVVNASEGSSLTLMNGSIDGTESEFAVKATGAELNLSDISISGADYGVYVGDHLGESADSTVKIVGSTINATSYAVVVSGNGTKSERKTAVVIENSEIISDGVAVSGNGDTSGNGRWGTDISIINSTVTGGSENGAGIYHPQKDSTLTVYKSDVSGYTGIIVKGGTVSIVESEVTGTGAENDPTSQGSGASDTGDALYIETNYGFDISVEIESSELTCSGTPAGKSIRVYPEADNVEVKIIEDASEEEQTEE